MKSIKTFAVIIFSLFTINICNAQKNLAKEKIKVWGNCEMCKKKIEKAAKEAGATFASWSPETKILKVTYNVNGSSTAAIQHSIANKGYDTPDYKATDAAYKSLDECCQYEREALKAHCCDNAKCEKKDGQCTNPTVCKEKGCGDMSCCKKS